MKIVRMTFLLLLIFLTAGCANLKAVRDYASESAKLSAYTELTTRFRDTYEREQPYLFGEAERLAKENDKRRKAAYEDLIKIHQRVSLYMQTLASLAGENAFDLSKEIDSLAGGIKAYPDFGINSKQVDAVAGIATVVAQWITSAYQESAVRDMVKEGNEPIQTTLQGMEALVRCFRKTNENERKTVLGFFEVEIPFADSPKDKLLNVLARAHAQSKTAEYKQVELKYDEAEKGIKSIADGHRKLFENIDKLSNEEVKSLIGNFAKDIKTIRENLQKVRN
ncbi:hypothetical protein ASZ90_005523 [hydrocarbon metagenome]|uniref:Lipoprotein n=1 Tax=hydrocarbon metagenome TaxID=938273 RepID=A0A0W8FV53_9ZZZZ